MGICVARSRRERVYEVEASWKVREGGKGREGEGREEGSETDI